MSLPTFLQDKYFLQEVDKLRIKLQFIKITVLNWLEEPLEEIQGIAISGSVNVDGSSSMRRTATLSIFAELKDNNLANLDQLFAINKKCILEIGIRNTVSNLIIDTLDKQENVIHQIIDYQSLYGDIIWFPLGVYVMFNPSVAHSMTGVTISLQLKDKMCLLNGDLGGLIHSSVDFMWKDEIWDADDVTIVKTAVPIYDIIKLLVNHWGNLQLSKIIITEVPLKIKLVIKWVGSEPCYLVTDISSPGFFTTEADAHDYIINNGLNEASLITYLPGSDIGYLYVTFTYPAKEFVCNAGETVTSMLDKIIQQMGNYEYFYDLLGNFRFQLKQNYLNMTNTSYWTKEQAESGKIFNLPTDDYKIDVKLNKSVYEFDHNDLVTAYNNTINFNNVKNDFVVWGLKSSITSGLKQPCRFHLAIDKKPALQGKHNIALYKDSLDVVRAVHYNTLTQTPAVGTYLFPEAEKEVEKGKVILIIENRLSKDWREEIYYQMLEDASIGTGLNTELNNTYFQYYAELSALFPKIFNLITQTFVEDFFIHPEKLDYFLDFIDDSSLLGIYSVRNIGRRAKIISEENGNDSINCVFEPVVPDIVFLMRETYVKEGLMTQDIARLTGMGQYWCIIPSYLKNYVKTYREMDMDKTLNTITTGGQMNSCYERIKDLLYQYTHMNNTISITTLPIYHFEPNTRITVDDPPSGIYGDYIIQSFNIPLDINSTMNINAYKALQKI